MNVVSGLWARTRLFRPVMILLVLMVVLFSVLQSAFLTNTNIEGLLVNAAVLWIVAMGMTFVLLSGGFDLSVGAVAAVAGVLMAKLFQADLPGGLVLVLVILAGALIGGILNGILVGRFGFSVFVVTLASMTGLTGFVDLWANGESFYVTAPLANTIGVEKVLGVPMPVWIMAGTFLLALFVQSRTYFGRDVYAVGGSPIAARLAGIRVSRTLVTVYAIVGACAALGGLIGVSRIGAATPQVDNNLPLEAIAAVLLGGTALSGGLGGVGGTALGVLFIAALNNGLSISGLPSEWQSIVTGVILIVAVAGDRIRFGGGLRRIRSRGGDSGSGEPALANPATATGAAAGPA